MANTRTQIEAVLSQKVKILLTPDRLKRAYTSAANVVLDDIRRTARRGISVEGSAMPDYSRYYPKAKGRFIRTGRWGKRTLKRTPLAAIKVRDVTVLTGRLHSDMQVSAVKARQDAQGHVSGSFSLGFRTARSREIDGYLLDNGYNYRWLSKISTAAGRRQRKLFIETLRGALGIRGNYAQVGEKV